MKDAKFFLTVRFTVEPQAEADLLRWLDGGHVAEVLRQPGFLHCKRLKTRPGEYMMLYGIESRAAFEASVQKLEQFMTLFPDAVRGLITERVALENAPALLREARGIKQVVALAA